MTKEHVSNVLLQFMLITSLLAISLSLPLPHTPKAHADNLCITDSGSPDEDGDLSDCLASQTSDELLTSENTDSTMLLADKTSDNTSASRTQDTDSPGYLRVHPDHPVDHHIGLLTSTFPARAKASSIQCTGFPVGDHYILTTASCVSIERGNFRGMVAEKVEYIPDVEGSLGEEPKICEKLNIYQPQKYRFYLHDATVFSGYNYAIVSVDCNFSSNEIMPIKTVDGQGIEEDSRIGNCPASYSADVYICKGHTVDIFGYTSKEQKDLAFQRYYVTGVFDGITENKTNTKILRSRFPLEEGMNGSPLFWVDSRGRTFLVGMAVKDNGDGTSDALGFTCDSDSPLRFLLSKNVLSYDYCSQPPAQDSPVMHEQPDPGSAPISWPTPFKFPPIFDWFGN